MVWVVSEPPIPPTLHEQINGNADDLADFDPSLPRFARPSGPHGDGINVVFADGHGQFMPSNIDYTVYQRLMTANGRKCVDPTDHTKGVAPGGVIYGYRTLPPLSEADYQ